MSICEKFKRDLGLKHSVIWIAILSGLLVIYQIAMQNGTEFFMYSQYFTNPLIFLLNFVPIFGVMLFFYFVSGRIWVGYLASSLPLTVMLIINEYKIFFRDEPFKPNDISLGGEATNIIQNYQIEFDLKICILSLIALFAFIAILVFIRNKRISLKARSVGALVTLVCLATAGLTVYRSEDIYNKLPAGPNLYNEVSVVSSKGFLYSFLVNATSATYEKPAGYSEGKVAEILERYTNERVTEDTKIPNIIAIMSEAFFDPQKGDSVEFYPGMNPMEGMNEIKKDAFYGDILVPGFAGSTASTEFEFLTGASVPVVSSSMPVVYKMINKDVYGLPRLFKDMGYDTLAIHPGHSWFYNRENVYERMAFDDFITMEDLPSGTEEINYYISDRVATDLIIDNYKKYLETGNENGYFNFTVTIQNHGPYMDHKTDREPRYVRPDGMSDDLYYTINNYMDGLADANDLLVRVKEYIDTVDEPTVLVFFGDHLPYLDSEFKGYDYLGYNIDSNNFDGLINRYSVPYIICSNDAAKELIKANGGDVPVGDNGLISSNYLCLELMKYMNMNLPPFYEFLDDLNQSIDAIGSKYYVVDGEYTQELPDELQKKIDEYRILQYYNLQKYKHKTG